MGFGWLGERSWSGSHSSSALRFLSSLKGGSVTLLDYWFPCAKPNSEVADVALRPRGKWYLKKPLKGGINSGCVLVVEQRCLVNCLIIPSLPPSVVVSPMPILIPHFPEVEPLLQPGSYHIGHPNLSCSLFVVDGGARCQMCLIGLLVIRNIGGRVAPNYSSVVSFLSLLPLGHESPFEDLMPTDLRLRLRYFLDQRMNCNGLQWFTMH